MDENGTTILLPPHPANKPQTKKQAIIIEHIGSTPILVDKGQKGRGTASCNLPATRYIIEANPLNVLKPRAFRFAAC
ncbi:MAG: hypothetical protein MSK63_06730, partial [Clostridiales bacterium]|nr:hypothetical protein [Clostridiales bacterium]